MGRKFKVAAVEFNPEFLAFETNLPKIFELTETAAKNGAKLIVLPEMATSGYIYQDQAQIAPFLDTIPGKTTEFLAPIAAKYHCYIAVGIGEIHPSSQLMYNSAALIGPNGYIGNYRKNQLNGDDEKWAARGNLGFPVFDTTLGKIALLICYDDSYSQSFLLPAIRGANIIAYLTASDRLPKKEKGSQFNHSTIANAGSLSDWYGTYIVASNRTGLEKNPANDFTSIFMGSAAIWDPSGNKLAQARVSSDQHPAAPETIYAEIDTAHYQNQAKTVLRTRRRPSLYKVLNLYRGPIDLSASTEAKIVSAALMQYEPINGQVDTNLKKIKSMLQQMNPNTNLLLFPEHSLLGDFDQSKVAQFAEDTTGKTLNSMVDIAKQYQIYVGFSMPEKDQEKFYATAFLLDPNGQLVGKYRKTHLNPTEQKWATAGKELPVFNTMLGRIAFMLGDEACIPDIADVLAVKRADMILIPTCWKGEYGRAVNIDPKLLIKPFPKNTMNFWYNIAKFSQAYTLVANYISPKSMKGCSALYSLDPVQGHYPPVVASDAQEVVFHVRFETLGKANWWMRQQYLIASRRVDLSAPLTLEYDSDCFQKWLNDSAGNHFCWHE